VYVDLRIYIYIEFQCTQLISLTTVSSVLFIAVNERSFRTVFSGSVRLQCDCCVITIESFRMQNRSTSATIYLSANA